MHRRIAGLLAAVLVSLLGACAQQPVQQLALPQQVWRDAEFGYDASLLKVDKARLFQLDAVLLADLRNAELQKSGVEQRMAHRVALVFGGGNPGFAYSTGRTTVAAQTWAARQGDCLSLTVLTYATARELNLPAQMQEVPVPVMFDRRGELEYLSGHVNVFVRGQGATDRLSASLLQRGTVIDFDPQVGVAREGQPLSGDGILARYYNNIGVSHLAKGEWSEAYAHFKAAIGVDAGYAASFCNPALLYHRRGLDAQAEQLLLHASAMADDSGASLRALQQLLLAQGRLEEAARYEKALQVKQEKDPHCWVGLGLFRLQRADYPGAISALELAQKLEVGFAEIHHYLAVAYARAGRQAQAQQQLALLKALNRDDPYLSPLFNKIARINAGRL